METGYDFLSAVKRRLSTETQVRVGTVSSVGVLVRVGWEGVRDRLKANDLKEEAGGARKCAL